MKLRSIKVCLRQGLQGVWRNRLMVLASVLTVSACLFILGVVYCVVANVRSFASNLDDSLGIIAFLSENVTDEGAAELVSEFEMMSEVREVHYVSSAEAWDEFKGMMGFDEQLGTDTISQLDQDNPLADSASLQIYLHDAADQSDFVKQLQTMPQFRRIRYSEETADVLSSLSRMVTGVGLGLIIMLIFIAVLLISNTIKLSVYVRHKEVSIMKYIGATNSFVKIPFVVEGIIIGLLGSVIPAILIYFSYGAVVRILETQFDTFTNLITFIGAVPITLQLIPAFVSIGVLVGIIGSAFSLQKYLKV